MTMKQMKMETYSVIYHKLEKAIPAPRFQSFRARKTNVDNSVTKREIAEFWRQKHIVEEDHLLDAKAAARIKACNLSVRKHDHDDAKEKITFTVPPYIDNSEGDEIHWWRKSKFAYLNQPSVEFMRCSPKPPRRPSTYVPNFFNTSVGVF